MCASCGCDCKPGKANKNCKCSCDMCKKARMSVEKSFIISKALRGFDDIADAIFEEDIDKAYMDFANSQYKNRTEFEQNKKKAKADYREAKRENKRTFKNKETIAGKKHWDNHRGSTTAVNAGAGTATGAAIGAIGGGKRGAAIGAGLGALYGTGMAEVSRREFNRRSKKLTES